MYGFSLRCRVFATSIATNFQPIRPHSKAWNRITICYHASLALRTGHRVNITSILTRFRVMHTKPYGHTRYVRLHMRRPLRAACVTRRHRGAALLIQTKLAKQRGACKRRLHSMHRLHMQPRALHRAACRQPTVIAPSRRPARCRSSERPQITYLCTAKQRAVMRLRMWGAGASETHTHSTARIAETLQNLQQLPAR